MLDRRGIVEAVDSLLRLTWLELLGLFFFFLFNYFDNNCGNNFFEIVFSSNLKNGKVTMKIEKKRESNWIDEKIK